MAKAPAKNRRAKSTKSTVTSNESSLDKRDTSKKPGKVKAGKKNSGLLSDPPPPIPEPPCCAACDGIPTGMIGMPWRDAAGIWHCLVFNPATMTDKRVACDSSGFYFANP